MSALNEMTIKQLIEAHNAIEGVEPIVAWKGRKDLLVEKVTEAIQKARGTQTIKSVSDALLTAVDYVDDAGKPIGFTYEHVLAKVLEQFPDANTTVKCLRWYNTKLNSDPNVKMPVRPRKRTAKVELTEPNGLGMAADPQAEAEEPEFTEPNGLGMVADPLA